MKKKTICTEFCYLAGVIILALGTALMEKAGFGMSMVVAPAYLIYLKLSQVLPFFTFGMAEYTLQAVLLAAMCLILRRFRVSYLFSFVTAVFYGVILDIVMLPAAYLPNDGFAPRAVLYVLGMAACSIGISLMFRTYISPEVYELFVKEIADKLHMEVHRFKQIYDISSALIGVALSFAFFGLWNFEGVKLGTILCALINGPMIGVISAWLDKHWEFYDAKKWRAFFAK